jgi:alpha-N-arabinofuranosidase
VQPHAGAHWQPPLASALHAQALLLQLPQLHPFVSLLDMGVGSLSRALSVLTLADGDACPALHLAPMTDGSTNESEQIEGALPPATVAKLAANHREFLDFLEHRVGNRAEAEDILQEAFVKGVERLGALRDGESASAWFYRVLRNAVVDHYRRRGSASRALDAFAHELEDQVEPGVEVQDAVCACVRTLSATLKPEYAQALQRIEVDGLSVSGYAAELGIRAGNAAVRVHRAREALRRRVVASCGTCAEHGCLSCTCQATALIRNPVLPGFYPDPSICRVGDDYYLVTSTFEYFPGVPIFHSRDLTHWRQLGHCLTRDSQLSLSTAKSSKGIFAPTLRYHDGTFYMITTNVEGGGHFYVTAKDATGPWSEPTWLDDNDGVDPSLFFDADGRVYFTRQGGGARGGIYQQELDLSRGKLVGEPRMIWSGTGGTWPEGPHLYKLGALYYLMIAEGGTGYSHMETIARSSSPWGPFEPCPRNPVLSHSGRAGHAIQATGHADLVQAKDGAWWLVCLGIRPTDGEHHHLGRETFLAPVVWDAAGWPVVNGNGSIELTAQGAGLPKPAPWPQPTARDDFEASTLGLELNFVRNPAPGAFSLSARPGFLRLLGTAASLDEVSQPSFVGRRQRHFRCRASALLEFQPLRSSEVAGLVVRADEANHYDLLVVADGARRRVELRARVSGNSRLVGQAPLEPGPVLLAIDAREAEYEFFFTTSGGKARSLGTQPTAPLSSEAAGGFTGVYFGMYASSGAGGGSAPAAPADFDWFEYRPAAD